MDKALQEKLLQKEKWVRALFLLMFFIIIKYLVSWLIPLIGLFQFICDLLWNKKNDKLLEFTNKLNTYIYQVTNFITFNTDLAPFPFTNWPEDKDPTPTITVLPKKE